MHAFPAPGSKLISPEDDLVLVSSDANVPGAIVLTRIPSLSISRRCRKWINEVKGIYGDNRPANIVAKCDAIH
jgi:hypothetical protein